MPQFMALYIFNEESTSYKAYKIYSWYRKGILILSRYLETAGHNFTNQSEANGLPTSAEKGIFLLKGIFNLAIMFNLANNLSNEF